MELQLRASLFWDVNVESIDLQQHRASVIERITTRGRLDEFREILNYYGWDIVKQTLLQTRCLDKVTLAFCSALFDLPISEFRCYKLAQLNPEHWNY
jgi:hypothetical protein